MKWLIVIIALLVPQARAATFYVSVADGDDTHCTGLAHTAYASGSNQPCPWKTVAKVNRSSFSAGDSILFKKGETWRESLLPPSAGVAGNVITIGAYGSGAQPIISGADSVTSWALYSGTTYKAALTNRPRRVWHRSTELTHGAGPGSLTTNQFYWASSYLYIKIGGNPTGQMIETTSRPYPLYVQKSYLTIDGLHFTKANEMNIISAKQKSDHVTIQNCTVDYAGMSGIFLYGDTATIAYWTFYHNTVSNNGTVLYNDHGIYVSHSSNNVFDGNLWEHNIGYAIQLQDNSNNNTVKNNYFHANKSGGIAIWDNTGSTFPTENVVFANVSNGDVVGLMVGGSATTVNNIIVNNTIYGYSSAGVSVHNGAHFGAFENNIVWSPVSGVSALYDNNGGAGMISDYNLIGPAAASLIYWRGTRYSTLAAYASATRYDTHSVAADAKFTNASAADFSLLAGSPAVNAGAFLGTAYNLGLDPRTTFPWTGLKRTSWDIGAFVYVPK